MSATDPLTGTPTGGHATLTVTQPDTELVLPCPGVKRQVNESDRISGTHSVEPDAGGLEAGDACRVGIPPTRVIVREVRSYAPAKDVGWLPRPASGLSVVPIDGEGDQEAGYLVCLDGAEPVSVTRT
jgi:hypothetical protein